MPSFYQMILWLQKRNASFFLLLITGFGFILRIYGLDNPGLWNDELSTFDRVNGDLGHTFNTLKQSPFPPLYYLLMNIWTDLFGFSEFSLRFPSMLFSTLSIIAIYFLAMIMFSKREGLISALFLCVSSYAINYSQEAKMYAMFWFFSILSFIFFFLYVQAQHRKHLILFGIFSVTAIYTSYLALILLFVQNVLFVLFYRENIKTWISANILIILSYAPWWYFAIYNLAHKTGITWIRNVDYPDFFPRLFYNVSGIWIGKSVRGEAWVLAALFIIAFIFSMYLMATQKNRGRIMNYLALFTWPLVYVSVFIVMDIYYTNLLIVRYLGVIHIPIIIIFSVGITVFFHMRLRWAGYMVATIVIASALYFHVFPFHSQGYKLYNENWREVMLHFCEVVSDNSLVLTVQSHIAMEYYGKCYGGDVIIVPPKTNTKSFILENNLHRSNYDSIFVVFRQPGNWKSDWIRQHQIYEKRMGNIGFLQIPLPIQNSDSNP